MSIINETSYSEFLDIWKNKQWNNGEKFSLYIDGPFCMKQCDFCIHWGNNADYDSEEYIKYYTEYLPYMFEYFKDIINLRKFDNVYFGGGTANLAKIEYLEKIFDCIPNIYEIKDKAFECHPYLLTKEQCDLFIKYKFSFISIGIQSLDDEFIKSKNRDTFDKEKIKNLVNYLQENGVNVNFDLLTFIDKENVEDLKLLKNDLEGVISGYSPNVISVYPNYRSFNYNYKDPDNIPEECKQEAIKKITELRKTIMKVVRNNPEYFMIKHKTLDKKDIEKNIFDNIHLSKMDANQLDKVHSYSCSSWPWHDQYQNVLGIGGYGNRVPYSYLGRDYYFEIYNEDWKPLIKRRTE